MTHPQQPAEPLYCPPCTPAEAERSATIDLDALEHNVRRLKELIGDRALIAVVKADAYGHGAYPVARSAIAAGADLLGVGARERGAGTACRRLRRRSWRGCTPSTDFDGGAAGKIRLGVSGWDLEAVAAAAERTGERAIVHLKADTGLGRNGATAADWPALVARAASPRGVRSDYG